MACSRYSINVYPTEISGSKAHALSAIIACMQVEVTGHTGKKACVWQALRPGDSAFFSREAATQQWLKGERPEGPATRVHP